MNYVIQRDELYHHGVIGMHWGIRRYQNEDGTRIKKENKITTNFGR